MDDEQAKRGFTALLHDAPEQTKALLVAIARAAFEEGEPQAVCDAFEAAELAVNELIWAVQDADERQAAKTKNPNQAGEAQ
jgi:hypothetical protein